MKHVSIDLLICRISFDVQGSVHRLHYFFIHIRLTVRTIACHEQWEAKENKAPVLFVHLQATLRQCLVLLLQEYINYFYTADHVSVYSYSVHAVI